MTSQTSFKLTSFIAALALALLTLPTTARAQSIIRQPGNHPDYSVELEPHLAFQWADRVGSDDGFGPGMRFNIPFVHNGPIGSINNSMGITLGFDLTFGGGGYSCYPIDRRVNGYACSVTEFWLPVAMQWNFYLTKVISVFGEPGFAIVHSRWDYPWFCNGANNPICQDHFSDTGVVPVFWGGGRFQFSDKVGATVRIGFPMITAGVNILL
jgi:hypothetical protein